MEGRLAGSYSRIGAFAIVVVFAIFLGQNIKINLDQGGKRHLFRRALGTAAVGACVSKSVIAMTFDGGISKTSTPMVLDSLKAAAVTATFHVTTEWLNDPLVTSIMGRIIDDGHTLGLSYRGPDPLTLTEQALRETLIAQSTAIQTALGVVPKFVRMPYGKTNATVNTIIASMGFQVTWWNIDANDYLNCANSPAAVSNGLKAYDTALLAYRNAGNLTGSFISLHSDLCQISAEVEQVIALSQKTYGYKFVSIETCIGIPGKYLSTPGMPAPAPAPAPAPGVSSAGPSGQTPNVASGSTTTNVAGGSGTSSGGITTVSGSVQTPVNVVNPSPTTTTQVPKSTQQSSMMSAATKAAVTSLALAIYAIATLLRF